MATLLISDVAYCSRCYYFVVCLSVTFVHCAQTAEDIDTISFAYTSQMCRNLAYIGQPFPTQFCPKVIHPIDLSVGLDWIGLCSV